MFLRGIAGAVLPLPSAFPPSQKNASTMKLRSKRLIGELSRLPSAPVLKIRERIGKAVETLIAIAPHRRANADGLLASRPVREE
jgi:hypothetical protein